MESDKEVNGYEEPYVDNVHRYRTVQFAVATSTFGSILTVAVFCGCFYFVCSKQHRQVRKDLWLRGSLGNGNSSTSNSTHMLITPYPTNPDLGTPVGNVDMNYTGAAPQMPVAGYSYDPVEPSYLLHSGSNKYNELIIVPPYENGNTNEALMSQAARIKEKIRISQPAKFASGMNFYNEALQTTSSREVVQNQTPSSKEHGLPQQTNSNY